MAENLAKFDPDAHPDGVYEAFNEFQEQYEYEYDAVAKDPPKKVEANAKTEWIEINKRKYFWESTAADRCRKNMKIVLSLMKEVK